jgi:hypothetical protein
LPSFTMVMFMRGSGKMEKWREREYISKRPVLFIIRDNGSKGSLGEEDSLNIAKNIFILVNSTILLSLGKAQNFMKTVIFMKEALRKESRMAMEYFTPHLDSFMLGILKTP